MPALEIFRRLPGSNCGQCGVPTCLRLLRKPGWVRCHLAFVVLYLTKMEGSPISRNPCLRFVLEWASPASFKKSNQ
ncbi:MAG: (Fe-S)-binding protein [Rectinemataceae bacterium]